MAMGSFLWFSVILHGRLLSIFNTKESSSSSSSKLADPSSNEKDGFQLKTSSALENGKPTLSTDNVETKSIIRVYTRRFWMLLLFSACSLMNCYQSFEYASLTNIYTCYYGVSEIAINWATGIYAIVYIVLVFPTICFSDRCGLRVTVLCGVFLGFLSGLIQCGSLNTNGFPMLMGSQAVSAVAQPLLLPIPPRLASVWFGPTEVGRATAVGVIGNMLGGALVFIVGPNLVAYNCTEKMLIRHGQSIETYSLTTINFVLFILVLLTFEDKPPMPPSIAEAAKTRQHGYVKSIKSLLMNANFRLLLTSNGIIIGTLYAVATLLNQILEPLYPGFEVQIGWIGLIAIVSGLFGSYAAGYVLDYSHKFKETMLAIAVLCFISMCCYTGLIYVPKLWLQFITLTILGFFLTSSFPVGFELACELTYPEPESSASSLINASTMVIFITLTIGGSTLIRTFGVLSCNLLLCAGLLCSCISASFIKRDYKRTKKNFNEAKDDCTYEPKLSAIT